MASAASIDHRVEDGVSVLYLTGSWRLPSVPAIAAALDALRLDARSRCVLDGSRLRSLDTAASFTLFRRLAAAGLTASALSARGFDPRHERLLALVHGRMNALPIEAHAAHPGLLGRIGRATEALGRLLATHTAFVGVVALESLALARRPRLFRVREVVAQFETAGLNAIPIVALLTFLIGVVFTYILGAQAQRYGAQIFVVDGMGLAICRELAPLLAAVIVAGRSGAAFTAQIGSMKVQEEIDAIQTLGLSPVHVLVIPRLVALMLALPLLVFVADVAGIAGGVLVAAWQLDIPPSVFIDRLQATLPMSAFVIGLAKAPVFAVFIAMIACRMGMLVARDARSVGENTTSTVVQSICWVIIIDALFAVVLQELGI
jgi:phospholipid/cholesterol/gamma-HCH transport system permease protein